MQFGQGSGLFHTVLKFLQVFPKPGLHIAVVDCTGIDLGEMRIDVVRDIPAASSGITTPGEKLLVSLSEGQEGLLVRNDLDLLRLPVISFDGIGSVLP